MNYIKLSNLLFPNIQKNINDIISLYPLRNNNIVTRVAPSPTGFMHLGSLYSILINERFSHVNNGIFYLRIEDTDQKRKINNGIEIIIKTLEEFEIILDESPQSFNKYGPYIQSQRQEIYLIFIKYLLSINKAYPCFCSQELINKTKYIQQEKKVNIGYYNEYASCRNLSFETIKQKIQNKIPYVIRLKSNGNMKTKISFKDLNKGNLLLDENFNDIIILKSDLMPTYHFAHVIDDYLMRTTHVIRGDEWLSTLPIHLQLFKYINVEPPKYLHTSHLMKLDNNIKRKLSKRKDPELALEYYKKLGYPNIALIEYLMEILNSNFEQWRAKNSNDDYKKFEFNINKIPKAGSLFDIKKLNVVSKNIISNFPSNILYNQIINWANLYNKKLYNLFIKNESYILKILSIGKNSKKARKDIINFSQLEDYICYFYDEIFIPNEKLLKNNIHDQGLIIQKFIDDYQNIYSLNDNEQIWFEKIKNMCCKYKIAENNKKYLLYPEKYIFDINHIIKILRIIITGKESSPELSTIMNILGYDKINNRLKWGKKICCMMTTI